MDKSSELMSSLLVLSLSARHLSSSKQDANDHLRLWSVPG